MYIIPYIGLLGSILVHFVSTSHNGSSFDEDLLPKDWPLFVTRFCGRWCRNGSLMTKPDLCTYPACFPCDCDETCSPKGTCCPTLGLDHEKVSYEMPKPSPNSYLDGIYQRLECRSPPFSDTYIDTLYLTVVNCPDTWKDTDVKQKCENPKGDSFDSVTPYTDIYSGLVFPNVFCLMCHGLVPHSKTSDDSDIVRQEILGNSSMLQAWPIYIRCLYYQNLFHLDDGFEFYKRAVELRECLVTFNETEYVTKCPKMFENNHHTVSACLPSTNDTLKELCHNLTNIPALRVSKAQNIFCSLCQLVKLRSFSCKTSSYFFDEDVPQFAYPPTVFLFVASERKGEDRDDIEISNCLSNQWENDKGLCISATCPAGKVVGSQHSCKTAFGDIRNLKYTLNMTLVIQETIPKDWYRQVTSAIGKKLRDASDSVRLQYQVKWCLRGDNLTIHQQEIDVSGSVTGPTSVSRDQYEKEMIDIVTKTVWHLGIRDGENVLQVVQLRPVCVGEELCTMYRNQSEFDNCFRSVHGGVLGSLEVTNVEITPRLTCPSVIVNLTTKPSVVDKNIVFTIELRNQSMQVIWNSNIFIGDKQFRMCLIFIKDLIRQLGDSTRRYTPFSVYDLRSTLLTISYFLDIVCIATSCICLMASISTYLLFPSLRNLPGLNNLCLCFSLLTAQVSLLVTSLLGSRGLLTEIHCLIHAMVLHYSWIACFVWMNTCCIHMYRIFTGHYSESHKRQFLWYSIYSFGFPLFVVVTLITITAVTTTGKSIGYGSDVCFLDTKTSSLIIILGLLAPLGITFLLNGILFILTVKQIVTVTKMQLQRKSTHGVFTYLKLSTVTGAFCFFTAASVQFESPIMFLISSPFAALQGVFIFTSFIVNKRILKMYKHLIFNREKPDDSCQSITITNANKNSINDAISDSHCPHEG